MTSGPAAVQPGRAGRPPWWLVAAGAAAVVVLTAGLLAGRVPAVDDRVAAWTAAWHLRDGAAYPLLWLGTALGGRGVLVVALLAVAGGTAWRHRTARPLVQAALALAALTAVVGAVKLGVDRPAPAAPPSVGGSSFPSGHVANAVVVWGVVRWQAEAYWQAVAYRSAPALRRAAAVLAVVGPVVVGLSVLALDFHWLSDVVAGAAVGVSLLGVVHALDGVGLSLWVRARAGRRSA